jgi:putative SOS response-associated peptidase YedK
MGFIVCSVVTLRTEAGDLTKHFEGLKDPDGIDSSALQLRIHGFLKKETAPVIIVDSQGESELRNKYFSLCPDWSKSWPFAFETYNARLSRPKRMKNSATGKNDFVFDSLGKPIVEEITHVPSFRNAFNRGQVCLVPISGAVESCYFGASAGKVVRFSERSDWFNPQTGEFIPTFTLLTDDPDPQVFAHGHDRGIIILDVGDWELWLKQRMTGTERLNFLRKRRIQPDWSVEVERELKAGWEKRAPSIDEIEQTKVWKRA